MEERELRLGSGGMGLAWVFALLAAIVGLIALAVRWEEPHLVWAIVLLYLVWQVSVFGFIVNGPNQARVVQLFGTYVGTVKEVGFFYGNPFYWRTRVSLQLRTFETGTSETKEVKEPTTGKVLVPGSHTRKPSKVNDLNGTPIE